MKYKVPPQEGVMWGVLEMKAWTLFDWLEFDMRVFILCCPLLESRGF